MVIIYEDDGASGRSYLIVSPPAVRVTIRKHLVRQRFWKFTILTFIRLILIRRSYARPVGRVSTLLDRVALHGPRLRERNSSEALIGRQLHLPKTCRCVGFTVGFGHCFGVAVLRAVRGQHSSRPEAGSKRKHTEKMRGCEG